MFDLSGSMVNNPPNAGEEALYNIGVVTRMTGISKATLRAWERRYEFPDSERTAGGHRLYSEHDIMRLRWVKNRIDQGMQTAQAIRALRHQESVGPLVIEEGAGEVFVVDDLVPRSDQFETTNPLMAIYQKRMLQAFMAKDVEAADQVLNEALVTSAPETLILEVIAPTLNYIGHAWEGDRLNVAVEHLATNYLRNRLMMWMVSGPPPRTMPPIVLACAPDEWHEMSLLIIATLLRRRRWPIAYIGQATPLSDLANFVNEIKPSLVVLVAMVENTAASLIDWPQYLPNAAQTGKPVVAYGGRVFTRMPELRRKMPGLYLGDNFQEGLATIETILQKTAAGK